MTETLKIARLPVRIAVAMTTLIIATWAAQGAPQPIAVSAHSSTAAENCWPIDGGKVAEDNATRVCRGKANLVVLINKGDARETVSVGHNRVEAAKEPAAQTSFGPFNTALRSVEWRIAGGNPFAIIQRWRNTGPGSDPKPLLVVSRLPPGAVCPVAYVDAAVARTLITGDLDQRLIASSAVRPLAPITLGWSVPHLKSRAMSSAA